MTKKTGSKFRKDHKFKFTKDQLREEIRNALMWTSDGLEVHLPGEGPKPLIMGDVDNLTLILTEILTEGLPAEEDAPSTAGTAATTAS